MPIEIRELLIKVRVEDSPNISSDNTDFEKLKKDILKECKREINRQVNKRLER